MKIDGTSGGVDTSDVDVAIRGNWGLPLQHSSGKSAPITGGWVTGSQETYTQIAISEIQGPEFGATTTGGNTWQLRNGVCCCVNSQGSVEHGIAAFNVVGVSFAECQEMLNQYDNTHNGSANVDIARRYISGSDIVFRAPVDLDDDGTYEDYSPYTIEGNCYPSREVIANAGGGDLALIQGPSGGPHDSSNYVNAGGCYTP